jgi:hypothetical protein
METYGKKLNSGENWAVAGIAGASAGLIGLITIPGLFLEIPYANGKFNIIRKNRVPVHWSVITTHVSVAAILVFLSVFLTAPLLRKRVATSSTSQ